jgi:hypothetical protein
MTTVEISRQLKVQHELVRDACGSLFQRCASHDKFNASELMSIVNKLREWKRL